MTPAASSNERQSAILGVVGGVVGGALAMVGIAATGVVLVAVVVVVRRKRRDKNGAGKGAYTNVVMYMRYQDRDS